MPSKTREPPSQKRAPELRGQKPTAAPSSKACSCSQQAAVRRSRKNGESWALGEAAEGLTPRCQLCVPGKLLYLSELPSPFERGDAVAPTSQRCYEKDGAPTQWREPLRLDYLGRLQPRPENRKRQPASNRSSDGRGLGHPLQGPRCSREESIVRVRESLCRGPE